MNKFKEIFSDLEQKILAKEYPPKTLLPSENQLIEHYGVSRETLRKALNLLKNAGYIQKKQGKGSIVLEVDRFEFPVAGLTSYKELQQAQHFSSQTIVHELSNQQVDDSLSEKTGWAVKAPVWHLVRQREIEGEKVILDRDYLLKEIVPNMSKQQAENSIYDFFEQEMGLVIAYAKKEITVEPVTEEIASLMDLKGDSHVVTVRSLVFLEDTRCFEYTESIHRLDKFRFVEFARRRKI